MPLTPFPPSPSRADPSTFADRGDAYLGHLENPFVAEANALESNVNAKEASTVAASLAAVNAVNISAWVSGTTYAIGVTVYDPVDLLSYRRKTAGAGTTRPGLDNTNWVVLNGLGNVRLDTNQTFSGVNTFDQPINGSGANLTNLNASNLSTGTVPAARLPISSQLQAEAGTDNTTTMTPLRTREVITDAMDGDVNAPRVVGRAAMRASDYPVLTVSAADTVEVSTGAGFESLTLSTTNTANPPTVVAARYTIATYTGSIRFMASHTTVSSNTSRLTIFKNGVSVQAYTTTSTTPVARTNDVSVIPGDVIEWRHATTNGIVASVVSALSATANTGYIVRPLYIALSEVNRA